jgi:hypothetical protein
MEPLEAHGKDAVRQPRVISADPGAVAGKAAGC